MAPRMHRLFTLVAGLALGAAVAACAADRPAAGPADVLSEQVRRWTLALAADTSRDENSTYIRDSATPLLSSASRALDRGRWLQALARFATAHTLLAAQAYAREHPGAARSLDTLEIEWKRVGAELSSDSARTPSLAPIRPALARALAEMSRSEARIYHEASLAYGRNTSPDAGLFYLGEAVAQARFVAFCRTLGDPATLAPPPLRDLGPEIDSLQSEMLALYRPPLSIDRHPEFIVASAALKEARALNAAGLQHGAMLRWMQATARLQPLVGHPPAFNPATTPGRLEALAAQLAPDVDHSLARLFLETARTDLEDTTTGATHASAAAIAEVVLPRYLAALRPAKPAPSTPPATATVTLVRWPYT